MHRTLLVLLALWLSLAPPLSAEFSLFNLFGKDKDKVELRVATNEDEAAAAEMLEAAMKKLEKGSTWSANRRLKKIIKDYPRSKAAAEALFQRAQLLMAKERWTKAFEALQEIVRQHPNYSKFDQVIIAQFECASALMDGARGRIFWVLPGFRQYSKATQQFEQIVINAPYGHYAPMALMNMAIVSEMRNKPEDAIDALDRLINYYPQSMLAPEAYYNLAQTYGSLVEGSEYDQGSTRQAISYYEDFLILFPDSTFIGEVESNLERMENLLATSRLNLGDFYYYTQSNNTAALIFYNEAITIAPESEAAIEAGIRISDIEAGVRPISSASIIRKLLVID